jgi:hypothetical protein
MRGSHEAGGPEVDGGRTRRRDEDRIAQAGIENALKVELHDADARIAVPADDGHVLDLCVCGIGRSGTVDVDVISRVSEGGDERGVSADVPGIGIPPDGGSGPVRVRRPDRRGVIAEPGEVLGEPVAVRGGGHLAGEGRGGDQ